MIRVGNITRLFTEIFANDSSGEISGIITANLSQIEITCAAMITVNDGSILAQRLSSTHTPLNAQELAGTLNYRKIIT